jgi:hypothetical protein
VAALMLAVAMGAACGAGGFFRQYEYEEDVYLSLDGTATVYVNSSLAALNALRGGKFDTDPGAPVDRAAVRDFFTSPVTHVTSVRASRRAGRRFVHVRVDVHDVRRLREAAPFAWSTYRFDREGDAYVFRQTVGQSVGQDLGEAGLNGSDRVAFRWHLPSRIEYQNAGPDNPKRGNILVWEQTLADRRVGRPLVFEARMQTLSILYRTLWLFAGTFVAVGAGFSLVIWWIMRRGGRAAGPRALHGAGSSADAGSRASVR